jgi:predicted TIM-barrel fold metal-dependent hydrolase
MKNKIAIEEHIATPETLKPGRYTAPGYWTELPGRLADIHGERLSGMDRAGIERAILSLNPVGVQGFTDVAAAVAAAQRANDFLAEQVVKRPDRFSAFAVLPMQDPECAAREYNRSINELGFKGAMVNGYSQLADSDRAIYYDLPNYLSFWAEVEASGLPFYLHPRDQLPTQRQAYEGHPWLIGAPWGFAEQTSIHALRLAGSGLFDKCPRLQVVLGHLGERILFDLSRLDSRLEKIPDRPAKRTMTEYFSNNFHVTTSGHFSTRALVFAMLTVGVERIMFAVDYPFEDNEEAAHWFDNAEISENDRLRIGRSNAMELFKLAPQASAAG